MADEKSLPESMNILKFVLMTEKSIRMIEESNKLIFIVERSASKGDVKKEIERDFEAPVASVKTLIDQKGRKKAFVKFKNPEAAGDIAMRLGII